MTDPTQQEWLANRLDRLESKMDERMDRLSGELKETRHTLRPMIETAIAATAQQEIVTRQIEKDLAQIDEWRREDGTLDQRLRRRFDELRGEISALRSEVTRLVEWRASSTSVARGRGEIVAEFAKWVGLAAAVIGALWWVKG